MRNSPNLSSFEGEVLRLKAASEGDAAYVTVMITANLSVGKVEDHLGARAGDERVLYAPQPQDLHVGARYRFEAAMVQGPQGQRAELKSAHRLPD